jgi:hypothetical protein
MVKMASDNFDSLPLQKSLTPRTQQALKKAFLVAFSGVVLYCTYNILFNDVLMLARATKGGQLESGKVSSNCECEGGTTTVPQYFQTGTAWSGPTATGPAPFLAQSNPASFAVTQTFVPNTPLETAVPVVGGSPNGSIFHLMGYLAPYFPNPVGFGINEYPLPPGANITQVQVP